MSPRWKKEREKKQENEISRKIVSKHVSSLLSHLVRPPCIFTPPHSLFSRNTKECSQGGVIFALLSRAQSYYWHTWCNILPTPTSLRSTIPGCAPFPSPSSVLHYRSSIHIVRERQAVSEERGERMIECRQSLRSPEMIHPILFFFFMLSIFFYRNLCSGGSL